MSAITSGVVDFIALFVTLIGYSLGLGAITVIEIHAWLGRHSDYWTEAAIRTHKITKPLIWIGLAFIILSAALRAYAVSRKKSSQPDLPFEDAPTV